MEALCHDKESNDSGEEEFEISGEAPNLEMSLTNFMQHMGAVELQTHCNADSDLQTWKNENIPT